MSIWAMGSSYSFQKQAPYPADRGFFAAPPRKPGRVSSLYDSNDPSGCHPPGYLFHEPRYGYGIMSDFIHKEGCEGAVAPPMGRKYT